MSFLTLVCEIVSVQFLAAAIAVAVVQPKLFLLMYKNLRRNTLRTALTSAAIVVLVMMVALIWTVVSTLDAATEEQSQEIKLIVTERWQLPSQMPLTHAHYMDPSSPDMLPELRPYIRPGDFMTWSFYGGSTDEKQITFESLVFMFCMNPDHIKPMMDDLENLDDNLVRAMKEDNRRVLLGKERLEKLGMRPGDKFKLYGLNYKGIDLEFEIAGALPGARWNLTGIMNADYFNKALDTWSKNPNNKNRELVHPLNDRRLNLIWLRVRDKDAVTKVADIIESSPKFADRPVKVETASSGIAAFLDAYRDLLWGVKWLLVPAILISMALVISNAIAITVRERRSEMAVLKVLGFRPWQIQVLVLGEAVLVGGVSGLAATLGTMIVVNGIYGGLPFPIAFFPAFQVPLAALAWGLAVGGGTGLLGSFLPAWTARSVKVSEVFSKVA
jgi:putative ABC transport system permease protein